MNTYSYRTKSNKNPHSRGDTRTVIELNQQKSSFQRLALTVIELNQIKILIPEVSIYSYRTKSNKNPHSRGEHIQL